MKWEIEEISHFFGKFKKIYYLCNVKQKHMEERKFNIGDRVVCIDKQYYDNGYHNGFNKSENHFIRSSIVSDVYEYNGWKKRVFYVDNYHHQVDSCGDSRTDQYGEVCEKDGMYTFCPRDTDKIWYHAEKDADEIKRVIDECKEDFHKKCEESRQKEISKLEAEIRYAQNRINDFKKGDKFMYCGCTKSEREWNDKMDEIINNAVGKK